MKALEKTIMVLAFLALVSQTVRHAYMLWGEPRGSVLDKYDRPRKSEIDSATSLDELLRKYESVRKQVDEARQERGKMAKTARDAETPEVTTVLSVDEMQTEPYKSEHQLREAINDWEQKSNEIRELWFFWTVGLVLLVVGMVLYRVQIRWFGLTLIIVALSEFVYWTSPTFFGGTREFDRLLWNKLLFSLISLALLFAVIWSNRTFADKKPQASAAAA
jgi:cation transport ATPase